MPVFATLLMTIVAPSPTTPTPWFQNEDYPVRAFERRQEGTTAFEVVVKPDGIPAACRIVTSSGHSTLDQRACAIATNRIRFTPASGPDGQPAYGVYRTQVHWAIDPYDWSQAELGPDFEVSVSKLPDGATGPIAVKYTIAVTGDGTVANCTPFASDYAATLGELGCEKLKRDLRRSPPNAGVESVQTAWISFTR